MAKHKTEIQVRWGDCDPAGIVFYPRYFEYFDFCTAELFRAVTGLDKHALLEAYDIVGFPMVNTGAQFILPNRFGETIAISTSVGKIGRSSFNVRHLVYRPDGSLAAEAHETRVWSARDAVDGAIRGVAMPPDLVALLRSDPMEEAL